MHRPVSIINCMWIAFHILHRVVKCCNLSKEMHKRIINNFNIIPVISLRYSPSPGFGPHITKPLPIDVFLIKMIQDKIWTDTPNRNLRE